MSLSLLKRPPTRAPEQHAVDADVQLVPLLISSSKNTRALIGIALKDTGMVTGQDQFLLALAADTSLTVSALADVLHIRPSTVSKMADRLQEKGLIERFRGLEDARNTAVRLTAAGLEAKAQVACVHAAVENELACSLGGDFPEIAAGLRHLDRVLATRLARLR